MKATFLLMRFLRWTFVGVLCQGLAQGDDEWQNVGAVGRSGATLYVSKLGDNSDGSSWARGFHTIQAALNAVPDDLGVHRIIIRPDRYMEANLSPAHKGAKGAYNTLEVDFDGSQGSGESGWGLIDGSDPEYGFKSLDWWSTFRETPDFSAVAWDRWIIRHVYATGTDGGLFFDLPPKAEEFSVLVEDSVGIGRAFGGGVSGVLSRPDEPDIFRRCKMWSLDWLGDAGGFYIRGHNPSMSKTPDVVLEDCTMVGLDNAIQVGYPGFRGYTHLLLKNCRLIELNFAQQGQDALPTGAIYSDLAGKYFQVALEDCAIMGFKVFGEGDAPDLTVWDRPRQIATGTKNPGAHTNEMFSYTTKGTNRAYVQFRTPLPAGFERLTQWPMDLFAAIMPVQPQKTSVHALATVQSSLVKSDEVMTNMMETTPVVWQGRLCLLECIRPASGGSTNDYFLKLVDIETGRELTRFGRGYGLGCAFAHGSKFYAFATRFDLKTSWSEIVEFESTDLKTWQQHPVIQPEHEHLFNSSVCETDDGFVMAYETDDQQYVPFTIKFARSVDLQNWTKLPDAVFGKDRYTACPAVRFSNGWFYLLYLESKPPKYETYMARSRDLVRWELSPRNPVLTPGPGEDINTSDADLAEFQGKTVVYYAIGDQKTWANLKHAVYPATMQEFFEAYFR